MPENRIISAHRAQILLPHLILMHRNARFIKKHRLNEPVDMKPCKIRSIYMFFNGFIFMKTGVKSRSILAWSRMVVPPIILFTELSTGLYITLLIIID